MLPHHCVREARLVFGWYFFVGHVQTLVVPTIQYYRTVWWRELGPVLSYCMIKRIGPKIVGDQEESLTQTLCLQPPKFLWFSQEHLLQLHMPQVYESDVCEELYQKLSGDLDTEYQCPFQHQYNQSSDWPLLKVAVHKIFLNKIRNKWFDSRWWVLIVVSSILRITNFRLTGR